MHGSSPAPLSARSQEAAQEPAQESSSGPDLAGALDQASSLAAGLDPALRYHGARHTFDEVLPAARALAADLHLSDRERALVEAAAAFHDLGFLERRAGHEQAAVEMVRRLLPSHGFDADAIERIAGMILATKLPQRPSTTLERIVADADMAVLASKAFLRRNEDLRLELMAAGGALPRRAWIAQQRRFLLGRRDHTTAARLRFGPGRRRNARLLAAWDRRSVGHERPSRSGLRGVQDDRRGEGRMSLGLRRDRA